MKNDKQKKEATEQHNDYEEMVSKND